MDASKTARKPRGKPFEKGNRANPKGRPAGSRNTATLMLDEMAEGESAEILGAVVKAAKGGDVRAAEIVLSRVWPIRRGRQVPLDLPPVRTASDVLTAIGRVVDAVSAGELTTEEGQALSAVLEVKRRTIETIELEARLAALERDRGQ